jgi:hypothetical protein
MLLVRISNCIGGSVRIIRTIWRDLRHGENVDLYPVVVISLAATVLSQLGIASQQLTLSLLLALVGLLAIAILVNRRQTSELRRLSLTWETPRFCLTGFLGEKTI